MTSDCRAISRIGLAQPSIRRVPNCSPSTFSTWGVGDHGVASIFEGETKMHIAYFEIENFRKLLSVRVDLSDTTTLFVGANNSGKTSAMLALRRFLIENGKRFKTQDFTLSHWNAVDKLGEAWGSAKDEAPPTLDAKDWTPLLPALDIWLRVENHELHYVSSLLPTLDWAGGMLGVRMRLEPKDLGALYKDYRAAVRDADAMRTAAAAETAKSAAATKGGAAGEKEPPKKLTLWPSGMIDFLSRRLSQHFIVRAYPLDPKKLEGPKLGLAQPQVLPTEAQPLEGNPLTGLIRINEINAQRGLGETDGADVDDGTAAKREGHKLSDQLRTYYAKHLDPFEAPDIADLGALQALEAAQDAFDSRLRESFSTAFAEVEGLGYPGVTDPKLKVATRLRTVDGLTHEAAVSFEIDVISKAGETIPVLRLPESYNGLGYQNLISMVFRLMSFRDAWMRVGKAGKAAADAKIEPLHLVLVEEPEAHLHAQVQQVFIKKAYNVLRGHKDLSGNPHLNTQLIVSTHSSHVAHETSFACLRYFRRLPAGMAAPVPVSTVANLSKVFGDGSETERFVTRYLRAQHADLFFADAAILVEGPAEKMLVPNFIREHYPFLNQCYVTLLEIGGSHAHRLKPLIDELGLLTLIVTDLDAGDGGKAAQPEREKGQTTNNVTLKTWKPKIEDIDGLLKASDADKILETDQLFAVRVAYQTPIQVQETGSMESEEALPNTFEDALAFENLDFFSKLGGHGLVRKFREAITTEKDVAEKGKKMFESLKEGKKAEFALEVIGSEDFNKLIVPKYIGEGLTWLEERLRKKQVEILPAPENEADSA